MVSDQAVAEVALVLDQGVVRVLELEEAVVVPWTAPPGTPPSWISHSSCRCFCHSCTCPCRRRPPRVAEPELVLVVARELAPVLVVARELAPALVVEQVLLVVVVQVLVLVQVWGLVQELFLPLF